MSLKSSKKIEENVWEIELSVDGEVFEAAVNKAYLKNRNRINVQGFRKGKAPRAFIEKIYGKEVFYEDALEIIYPEAVSSAIEEAKLDVVGMPHDLEVPEMGAEGVVMKLKVDVKPVIELPQYKGIKAEKKSTKVTAAEVKNQINSMLEQNSRLVNVDRKVKSGDITVIDFEGFVDGVAFEGGKAESYELTIGSNQFIPGFEDQIIGHSTGEEFDVNVKFPTDYHAELADKDAVFKIKLHEVKVKEVPALDDEFVKDVSEFDTVDEFKKNVKEELENKKKTTAEAEANNAVLDVLAESVTVTVPQSMIESKVDADVDEFAYRLQSQGLDMKTYMKYTGMDEKAFRDGFKDRAEKQVKLDLAIEKIIEAEKFEVSDDEINAEYDKYAKAYSMDIEQIKKAIPAESLKPELLQRKAIDFVIENAVFTEEKAEKKSSKSSDDEEQEDVKEKKTATKKAPAKKTAAKKSEDAE